MPSAPTYRNRRLALTVVLMMLGMATGFVWGRLIGYKQGKADTIRAIEQKLTEPKPEILPT